MEYAGIVTHNYFLDLQIYMQVHILQASMTQTVEKFFSQIEGIMKGPLSKKKCLTLGRISVLMQCCKAFIADSTMVFMAKGSQSTIERSLPFRKTKSFACEIFEACVKDEHLLGEKPLSSSPKDILLPLSNAIQEALQLTKTAAVDHTLTDTGINTPGKLVTRVD